MTIVLSVDEIVLPDNNSVPAVNPVVAITLPPVMLPVADITPPVSKLPAVVLAVTVNEPNVPTEVMLVCVAVVNVPTILVPDKLPPVILPLALNTPVMYSPVVANTATLPVPPTPTETLPPELTTVTFDVPLLILATDVITPVSKAPLPKM